MSAMQALRSLVVAVVAFVVPRGPRGRAGRRPGGAGGWQQHLRAHIGRLPNPDNNARDMSAALRRLGFEVTTEFDADRVELTEALGAFTRRSAGADISLVFYAGHGIEMDGVNYLVPVDARLERDVDVRFETVTVDDFLVSTSDASLRLLILDACRNPLARSMQRTAATRTVAVSWFRRAAEQGYAPGQTALGFMYSTGRGVGQNYEAAFQWSLRAANQGNVPAQFNLGNMYRDGRGVARDLSGRRDLVPSGRLIRGMWARSTTSARWTAMDAACHRITTWPSLGSAVPQERGDPYAQNSLGAMYRDGQGVRQDHDRAVAWFRRAADQGNAAGQTSLGRMYENGRGVRRDRVEAVRWYRRAADQGDPWTQEQLDRLR